MRKQKVIMLESEQLNKKDLDAIHELQEGLDKIDQFPVYTPDLHWFENIVAQEKERAKKQLIKELVAFIVIAVFILSGIIFSLSNRPIIFIFFQILTVIFLILYSGIRVIKQVSNR